MHDDLRPDDPLEGIDLEPGLAAAFEAEQETPAGGQSVLAQLAGDGQALVPVLLREVEGTADLTPLVRPGGASFPGGKRGRYQIVGEIARGGVGVVLKGHDVDLGRDVALKVVREEFRDNPDVVQRFIEEAQIGGQLQHPGIVPVYEIGVGEDKRPFFTMKLVKGKTLSALLSQRGSVEQQRGRLLSIFESVCQTMAYAHARGVIHRDLKPSNVMLGAFGEVVLVDWGLGKVLRHGGVEDERRARRKADETIVATYRSESDGSQSVVGSVIGTPRYMAPEQARGDLERVDERSDVFGLGAILCEILTGKPPYAGERDEIFGQAAMARLDPAYERLAASGADAELVDIVRRCLAPAPEARPANAGELAKLVGAYLGAAEERLQASRLAAARAEERAEAESAAAEAARALARQERATAAQARRARRLTLALATTVLLAVVGGGGIWMRRQTERADARLATAEKVNRALERATLLAEQATASQALETWEQALTAAQSAEDLLDQGEGDPSLRDRTTATLQRIQAHAGAASEVREAMARAGQLVQQGDVEGALAAYARASERMPEYAQAHASRGALLRGEGRIGEAIAAFRQALSLRPSRDAVYGLIKALSASGDHSTELDVARKAVQDFPDDAGLYNVLGGAYPNDQIAERIAAYGSALRAEPGHGPATFNLTNLYRDAVEQGDTRVLDGELTPHEGRWRVALAGMCYDQKRYPDALRLFELAFDADPALEQSIVYRNNHRIFAALAALEIVRTESPPAAEADALRSKALERLDAHVEAWRKGLAEADAGQTIGVLRGLARWSRIPAVLFQPTYGLSSRQLEQVRDIGRRLGEIWKQAASRLGAQEDVEAGAQSLEPALVADVAGTLLTGGDAEKALRLFEIALERAPALGQTSGVPYNAACAALRLASAPGAEPERAGQLRGRALALLAASREAFARTLARGNDEAARKELAWWREDPDLASVRNLAIDALPEAERAAWKALWDEVEALLRPSGGGSGR